MKKLIVLSLAIAISSSSISLADNPAPSPVLRKSKEIALIKAVGGIILTTAGSIHSVFTGPLLIYDSRDYKGVIGGITVSTVSLSAAYLGYTIAKNGFDELNEIAQYPDNNYQNQPLIENKTE